MSVFNVYSFALFAGFLLVVGLLVVLARGRRRSDWIALGIFTALILAAWWVIRPTESAFSPSQAADAVVGQGKPVLLEAQSPF